MKPVCIIPARSGSKRIKNKNIKKINGTPLIGITIKIAKKSNLFSDIVVSTDSKKIGKIASHFGASVPFLRKKGLSDDFTPSHLVIKDSVKKLNITNSNFAFCIYPSSILLQVDDLRKGFKKIVKQKSDFICCIKKYIHNPQRSFRIKKNKIFFEKPFFQNKRSQDLEKLYYDTGLFYIYRIKLI